MLTNRALAFIVIAATGLSTGFVLLDYSMVMQSSARSQVAETKKIEPTLPQAEILEEAVPSGYRRVFVTPFTNKTDQKIRGRQDVDVRHDFGNVFSANVPIDQIETLRAEAFVEPVPFWSIEQAETPEQAQNPNCGNGTIEPSEFCGEPGLPGCLLSEACVECKCKKVDQERTCLPNNQIDYSVAQVNGGQLGGGEGISVAVLDTGAVREHLDLDIAVCKDTTQRGMRNGCVDGNRMFHGTRNAAIIGANGGDDGLGMLGVAPTAEVWSIKVCLDSGICYIDDIIEAMNFVGRRKVNIANMSFSGGGPIPELGEIIRKYPETLWVGSAGNRGPGQRIGYPAAEPEVIAAGAIDQNKAVTNFSSRGINDGDDSIISEREVELVAAGVMVQGAHGSGCYTYNNGTSYSAPLISGLAAKLWQGSAQETREYLWSITEDITQATGGGAMAGFDTASGFGLPVAP